MPQSNIDSILKEDRVFDPPEEFSKQAHIKSLADYEALWQQAHDDPEVAATEADIVGQAVARTRGSTNPALRTCCQGLNHGPRPVS